METENNIEYYTTRFTIMSIVVFTFSSGFAFFVGTFSNLLFYAKVISGCTFLLGALIDSFDTTNQSHDIVGKTSGVWSSNRGIAHDHDPLINQGKLTSQPVLGYSSYLTYGGLLVLIFTVVIDWII